MKPSDEEIAKRRQEAIANLVSQAQLVTRSFIEGLTIPRPQVKKEAQEEEEEVDEVTEREYARLDSDASITGYPGHPKPHTRLPSTRKPDPPLTDDIAKALDGF